MEKQIVAGKRVLRFLNNETCPVCKNIIDDYFWLREIEFISPQLESFMVIQTLCEYCGPSYIMTLDIPNDIPKNWIYWRSK